MHFTDNLNLGVVTRMANIATCKVICIAMPPQPDVSHRPTKLLLLWIFK